MLDDIPDYEEPDVVDIVDLSFSILESIVTSGGFQLPDGKIYSASTETIVKAAMFIVSNSEQT